MSAPLLNPRNFSPEVRENLVRQGLLQAGLFPTEPVTEPPAERKPKARRATLTPAQAPMLVKNVSLSEDHNKVVIVMAINPYTIPTAQQKGAFVGKHDGRVHFFTKSKVAKAEKALQVALNPYAHMSRSWGQVPIALTFDFLFPYTSGTPKKHLHKIGPMLQKPDCDNICKGFADALTRSGFWEDDSLINTLTIRKRRTTETPCIKITIENLAPRFEQLYAETENFDNPDLFSEGEPSPPSEVNPLSALRGS